MHFFSILYFLAVVHVSSGRYIMYLTGQHDVVPEQELVSDITHVALAFMQSSIFNQARPSSWPLFTTVEKVRTQFAEGTSIMVAIGGWGDTEGFSKAAATDESRDLFAKNVRAMVDATGADGVDIDWEYPGGNGEEYKRVPNSAKKWEIDAYPLLLSAIREALGPDKIMSAAVPGLPRDMLAFTRKTIPKISASLDFYNIMTYDLMNRRDNVTKHHTGLSLSLEAIETYLERGVQPEKANLGFAFYVKWFKTDPNGGCDKKPVGCKTALMEDPETGADLGQAGGFSWHDTVPPEVEGSFRKALKGSKYDEESGGNYYWDADENLWWSWDNPQAIARKFPDIVERKRLGGVFAWGLGEDAPEWKHLTALTSAVQKWNGNLSEKERQQGPPHKEEL